MEGEDDETHKWPLCKSNAKTLETLFLFWPLPFQNVMYASGSLNDAQLYIFN